MSKSYWQTVSVRTENDRKAIKSYFRGLCDEYTPESAAVLCDAATDREKKLRVVMVDSEGVKRIATLSRNKREDVINIKRAAA